MRILKIPVLTNLVLDVVVSSGSSSKGVRHCAEEPISTYDSPDIGERSRNWCQGTFPCRKFDFLRLVNDPQNSAIWSITSSWILARFIFGWQSCERSNLDGWSCKFFDKASWRFDRICEVDKESTDWANYWRYVWYNGCYSSRQTIDGSNDLL